MKRLWVSLGQVLILALAAVPVMAITWGQPDAEHASVGAMMMVLPASMTSVLPPCWAMSLIVCAPTQGTSKRMS